MGADYAVKKEEKKSLFSRVRERLVDWTIKYIAPRGYIEERVEQSDEVEALGQAVQEAYKERAVVESGSAIRIARLNAEKENTQKRLADMAVKLSREQGKHVRLRRDYEALDGKYAAKEEEAEQLSAAVRGYMDTGERLIVLAKKNFAFGYTPDIDFDALTALDRLRVGTEGLEKLLADRNNLIGLQKKEILTTKADFKAYREEAEAQIARRMPSSLVSAAFDVIDGQGVLILDPNLCVINHTAGCKTELKALANMDGKYYKRIFANRESYEAFEERLREAVERREKGFSLDILEVKCQGEVWPIRTDNRIVYEEKEFVGVIVGIDRVAFLKRLGIKVDAFWAQLSPRALLDGIRGSQEPGKALLQGTD